MTTTLDRLRLYFHTVRYLKPEQMLRRAGKLIGCKCALKGAVVSAGRQVKPIRGPRELDFDPAFLCRFSVEELMDGQVCLLHEKERFGWDAPWYFENRSALWNFNLHYCEFLLPLLQRFEQTNEQRYLDRIEQCIRGWIRWNPEKSGGAGWSAYTISMRLPIWLTCYTAIEQHMNARIRTEVEESIFAQYRYLSEHLERDILGNHYFENLKALILCALFFDDQSALEVFTEALRKQCGEQILSDGMHFERSLMYHDLVLESLIRVANALRQAGRADAMLEECVQRMLDATYSMQYGLDRLPLFNDAGTNVAKSLSGLLAAADCCFGMKPALKCAFPEAGYYILRCGNGLLVVDAGPAGPRYLPGHAHCDAMSFELFRDGHPVLVNCGTYGYQCEQRDFFRSTQAHNTVQVMGVEQSEYWSVFRMARRSKTEVLALQERKISMLMTDYKGHRICREIALTADALEIRDSAHTQMLQSYLHMTKDMRICTNAQVQWERVPYAPEYGALQTVQQLTVTGTGLVEIQISLP